MIASAIPNGIEKAQEKMVQNIPLTVNEEISDCFGPYLMKIHT